MRVCIIDDSQMIVEALALVLRDKGISVDVATDGRAGLRTVATQVPDVALVDLEMPGMSGTETIAELRLRFPDLPIVATSGRRQSDVGGADLFVEKPFTPNALIETLAAAIARRSDA